MLHVGLVQEPDVFGVSRTLVITLSWHQKICAMELPNLMTLKRVIYHFVALNYHLEQDVLACQKKDGYIDEES